MQAEIFDNLLERYSYSSVSRMLGLTAHDRSAIEATLKCRREQGAYEESELEAMRTKQLRELSKLDNSSRGRRQSQQLLFQKASRQAFRDLNRNIRPEQDLFSCEASELATAKRFLRWRGITTGFLGAWENGNFLVHGTDEETSLEELGLDEDPGPKLLADVGQPAILPHNCSTFTPVRQLGPSLALKEAFINWLGDLPTGTRLPSPQPKDQPTTSEAWLSFLHDELFESEPECNVKSKEKQSSSRGSSNSSTTLPVSLRVQSVRSMVFFPRSLP